MRTMRTTREQGGMAEKCEMRTELRKLDALRIGAQATIEKWLAHDSMEMQTIEDAAREMYAMTSDFEAELAEKYGTPRSFAFMMESLFGECKIKKLFKTI